MNTLPLLEYRLNEAKEETRPPLTARIGLVKAFKPFSLSLCLHQAVRAYQSGAAVQFKMKARRRPTDGVGENP